MGAPYGNDNAKGPHRKGTSRGARKFLRKQRYFVKIKSQQSDDYLTKSTRNRFKKVWAAGKRDLFLKLGGPKSIHLGR